MIEKLKFTKYHRRYSPQRHRLVEQSTHVFFPIPPLPRVYGQDQGGQPI